MKKRDVSEKEDGRWLWTGIKGFDELLERGVPKGSSIIVSGGPGTGKTIFCLQLTYNIAKEGKDCVYLSLEEAPERLKSHMEDFGFDIEEIKRTNDTIYLKAGKGRVALRRLEPISIARSVEALLEKATGRLTIDTAAVLDMLPGDMKPTLVVMDSISAMATAFSGRVEQYRIYIEQLFRYFEKINVTSFLITETNEAPFKVSKEGVEEFLADGIIVFYYIADHQETYRVRGIEILKLRGAKHSTHLVQMEITKNGIIVHPWNRKLESVVREKALPAGYRV
ncbi:MAG: ATPase domain-containing protein [Candidatus Hadarchaeales archaeon]